MSDTVKGTRPITSTNSPYNALSFMMEQAIKGKVNTAIPVRVDSVEAGGVGPVGYVSATPLVCQRDGFGNTLPPTSIPRLPYTRIQGGVAALIIDPMPGDVGIAVFAQQDISTVGGSTPSQAGSFRSYDMADGMYIGGIINKEPEVYIELTQEGVVTIHAPQKIVLDSPLVEITGQLQQTGSLGQGTTLMGGLTNTGGSLSSNGTTFESHTHKGVQSGSGSSGAPNEGT